MAEFAEFVEPPTVAVAQRQLLEAIAALGEDEAGPGEQQLIQVSMAEGITDASLTCTAAGEPYMGKVLAQVALLVYAVSCERRASEEV